MTLALIAGTGRLPPVLMAHLSAQGEAPLVCEMRGFASEVADAGDRLAFRIETLGSFLSELKARGVTRVCMAGAMRRPQVDPAAIDEVTAPLVHRLTEAMALGDDGTLRAIVALFEEAGFEVVGAHGLMPDLLPPLGVLTRVKPGALSNDLAVAVTALREMGRADMGQAMLVRAGHVIAREDDRGTDAMLMDFCKADGPTAEGAFLYKAPKPGQLRTVDMPTIGTTTAVNAIAAGLSGIVIAEGGVMVLDRDDVIRRLDDAGLFLWVAP